jgi:hypothetical protein
MLPTTPERLLTAPFLARCGGGGEGFVFFSKTIYIDRSGRDCSRWDFPYKARRVRCCSSRGSSEIRAVGCLRQRILTATPTTHETVRSAHSRPACRARGPVCARRAQRRLHEHPSAGDSSRLNREPRTALPQRYPAADAPSGDPLRAPRKDVAPCPGKALPHTHAGRNRPTFCNPSLFRSEHPTKP